MTTEANKRLSREFHACFDAGDFGRLRTMLAPGAKAYNTGVDHAQDIDEFEAMGRGFFGAFSQSRHVMKEQVAEGDKVFTLIDWSAIHTGSFNGIPPSNRPVKMEVAVYDRYDGGKIAEHRAIFDVMGLLQQLGVIPAAA